MNKHKLVPAEPTDDELLDWAGEEQFFLFCDKDDFLQIARAVMQRYAAPQPAEQQPDVTALVEALELALEYWRDRQQRYKNRKPRWVADAEAALAAHRKQGGEV